MHSPGYDNDIKKPQAVTWGSALQKESNMSYAREFNTPEGYYEENFVSEDQDRSDEFKYHCGEIEDHVEALKKVCKEFEFEWSRINYHLKQMKNLA